MKQNKTKCLNGQMKAHGVNKFCTCGSCKLFETRNQRFPQDVNSGSNKITRYSEKNSVVLLSTWSSSLQDGKISLNL